MGNQWKGYASLKDEQDASLRKLVSFAYENVPYYHKLFKELDLKPDDVKKVEDLQKLPVLTKEIIKRNWDDLRPMNLNSIRYVDKATGGSTGTPLEYRMSKRDQRMSVCLQYRGWSYAGYHLSDRVVFMGGSSLMPGAKSSAKKRMHEILKNIRMLSSFDMSEAAMEDYAREINESAPKYLFGYASSIYHFSSWLEKNGKGIHRPEGIFTTAEKLFPKARKTIEETFMCPVYDTYGLNDGGVSAFECSEKTGFHIDTERAIMEVVDKDARQLEKGEGLILATSLHNYAMPFIRYDTGDVGVLSDETCPCGRGYRLLKAIKGREQEMLTTPEGTAIHGEFFTHIFWDVRNVREFQVVQDRKDHLTIKIVPEPDFDKRELEDVRGLIAKRSPGWRVDFEITTSIDRTKAGKYRFVISEMTP